MKFPTNNSGKVIADFVEGLKKTTFIRQMNEGKVEYM